MAFPEDLSSVFCVGFDREALPIIVSAVENGRVKWNHAELKTFGEVSTCVFDFLGFRYRVTEFYERITGVAKIAEITLDEDENGEPIEVIREMAVSPVMHPKYQEGWGEF